LHNIISIDEIKINIELQDIEFNWIDCNNILLRRNRRASFFYLFI